MSDTAYFEMSREGRAELHRELADMFFNADPGSTWTNEEICRLASIDCDSGIGKATVGTNAGRVRTAIEAIWASKDMPAGFARRRHLDKEWSEHFVVTGAEFVFDRLVAQQADLFDAMLHAQTRSVRMIKTHKGILDRKQRYTAHVMLSIAERIVDTVAALDGIDIPKLVAREPQTKPLLELFGMIAALSEDLQA